MSNNFFVSNHPIVKDKVSLLRNASTDPKTFRSLISDISSFLCYELTSDLELSEYSVETPLEMTTGFKIKDSISLVAVLRAGIGMVTGFLKFIPDAKIGLVGLYRDHESLKPIKYYSNLSKDMKNETVIVLDPMLATGGSSIDSINFVKKEGATKIKFACIIAAPEGVKNLQEMHPDVPIYCACLDRGLNDSGYILPGLGDAGDRIFATI